MELFVLLLVFDLLQTAPSSGVHVPNLDYLVIAARRQQVAVLRVPRDCVHVLVVGLVLPGNRREVRLKRLLSFFFSENVYRVVTAPAGYDVISIPGYLFFIQNFTFVANFD